MAGLFMNLLGDAIGDNGISVVASALSICMTNFSWRFCAGPIVTLIITAIGMHAHFLQVERYPVLT